MRLRDTGAEQTLPGISPLAQQPPGQNYPGQKPQAQMS